ncbi:hypothetical protein CEQ90_03330 [Lewinellaceae bacterium SD302]|nr:hypothetical protein CEQ90_03330 [Lewinellaceae bacterium SD302]
MHDPTTELLNSARACTHCAECLPLGPRPIVDFTEHTRILLISQAPGSIVHKNGVPWLDHGGKRLREWLGVTDADFFDPNNFGIMPMGFCYPGKGKSGDLPPRPECAPLWHDRILAALPNVQLRILIGAYAQKAYLGKRARKTLTETVRQHEDYLPAFFPLPHPSPRNRIWLAKNDWFENETILSLRKRVSMVLTN